MMGREGEGRGMDGLPGHPAAAGEWMLTADPWKGELTGGSCPDRKLGAGDCM